MSLAALNALFPALGASGRKTSESTSDYNCIAWAAGDNTRWWSWLRGAHWPLAAPRQATLAAVQSAFATVGYSACSNGGPEGGLQKIAIFVDRFGEPSHVARQLAGGAWTSKIGRLEDICHDLRGLEGVEYGAVGAFMFRTVAEGAVHDFRLRARSWFATSEPSA